MKKEESENPETYNLNKEDDNSNTNESKKENKEEEDEDDELDYFDPLNEKGELRIPLKTKNKFKKDDFDVIALSGKGAYGTVLKVKFKKDTSDKYYAIKVMDVLALDRIKKLYQAYLECDILSQLESPYIVDILGAFDENRKIYIVMQYLSKGDFSEIELENAQKTIDKHWEFVGLNFSQFLQKSKTQGANL